MGRGLLRLMLSQYVDVSPRKWNFQRNSFGKPVLLQSPSKKPLCFNLSHTRKVLAMAFAYGHDLGIDVESVHRELNHLDVARSLFSRVELSRLMGQDAAARPLQFFRYWTLKEAFVKAKGIGLSYPTRSFTIHDTAKISVSFEGDKVGDGNPACWQFSCARIGHDHILSLAIERQREPDLQIVMRSIVDFREKLRFFS